MWHTNLCMQSHADKSQMRVRSAHVSQTAARWTTDWESWDRYGFERLTRDYSFRSSWPPRSVSHARSKSAGPNSGGGRTPP